MQAKNPVLILALFICANAANLMSNGDMEYGDGGWYLWNNPDGPADVESIVAGDSVGEGGSKGAMVIVKKPPQPVWGLQLQAPKWLADSAVYKLSFKAKGNGILKAVAQGIGPDWREKESGSWELTSEWAEYSMPFLADQKGYGLNNINFQLGFIKDTVFIDNVVVEPLGADFDTTWYSEANARIEKYRKQDFSLKAKAGDSVRIELVRHEFPFGTALALNVKQDSVEKWYRETAAKYFWHGVNENIFKWPDYEPEKGKVKREEMQEYIKFTQENGWDLRGHAIVWGHQGYGFDKHWSIQGSCEDLEKNIKERIDRDLKEYQGKFIDYDVWNEPFHEPFLFNKCGWQILDSAFIWAHRADPSAKLYINEYNVVAAGETDRYYALVKGMLDRGIPVHGVGVQCHFQTRPVIPVLVKERLDKLASLGLLIKVTELDFGSEMTGLGMSEERQAEQYKTFLTTAFSHPAVNGILLWGFWDNRHWVKNGGIIDSKGRAKPAADTIYNLWHKTWATNLQTVADESGEINFRGFPGKYKITIGDKEEFVHCKVRCEIEEKIETAGNLKYTPVSFLRIFDGIFINSGKTFIFNHGFNSALMIGGTYALVQTGGDWKFRQFAYDNDWVPNAGAPAVMTGGIGPVLVPLSLYGIGRFNEDSKMQTAGVALMQATIISTALTTGIKALTSRREPHIWGDDRQPRAKDFSDDWKFGFFERVPFDGWPSGHTSAAWAMAATLTEFYPDNIPLAIGLYGYATYMAVGVSTNIHWLSDGWAGALFGYAVGKTVSRHFIEKDKNSKVSLVVLPDRFTVVWAL